MSEKAYSGLFLAVAFLAFSIPALASDGAKNIDEKILTPSELNAHAAQYDGKTVYVRGWVIIGNEEAHIWDSKEASETPWPTNGRMPNSCVSYLGDVSVHTSGEKEILYGTFWRDFAKSLHAFDFGTCNWSGLEVIEKAPHHPK